MFWVYKLGNLACQICQEFVRCLCSYSIIYCDSQGQGQRSTAVNVSNIFETSVRYTNLVFTSELANNRSEVYLNTSKMVCAEVKPIDGHCIK